MVPQQLGSVRTARTRSAGDFCPWSGHACDLWSSAASAGEDREHHVAKPFPEAEGRPRHATVRSQGRRLLRTATILAGAIMVTGCATSAPRPYPTSAELAPAPGNRPRVGDVSAAPVVSSSDHRLLAIPGTHGEIFVVEFPVRAESTRLMAPREQHSAQGQHPTSRAQVRTSQRGGVLRS